MYEYYYRLRPPGTSCQPDGFDPDTRECWRPRKDVNGISYHGKVSYQEPLSHEDLYHYDLRPVDLAEYAEYVFWREQEIEGVDLRFDYLNTSRETLEALARRDILAQAALVILDARKESEND